MQYNYISPIGPLLITYNHTHIIGVHFDRLQTAETTQNSLIQTCIIQLDEYFAGSRKTFVLPLEPPGTDFQRRVWSALQHIDHGKTATYGTIAAAIGNPKASRAVGGANNKNPIIIIIPCHRIIGSTGAMVGYGGGLHRKIWLLEHESKAKLS